jgi:hypothetical protein
MPFPSTSLSTLRPELGTLMEFDLAQNQRGLIGYQVLPILQVKLAAGNYGRIPSKELGKLNDVRRTKNGGYNRGSMRFTEGSYSTREYGFEMPVDRNNAAMYAQYFDAEVAASEFALNNLLLKAELRVASRIFSTSIFTGSALTTAVSVPWSNLGGSTPVADVRAASQKVRDNCGQYANAMIINRKVMRQLQDNEEIIDRITSSGAGNPAKSSDITPAMLAQVFDIQKVLVADSCYDTANEDKDTVFGDIWSPSYCMVGIIGSDGGGIEKICLGRTLHWAADGSKPGGLVESYYEEKVRGDVIRVRHQTQEKIVYKQAGHLLTGLQ